MRGTLLSRRRSRPWALQRAIGAVCVCLAAGLAGAPAPASAAAPTRAPGASEGDDSEGAVVRDVVGPLRIAWAGRDTVRGGRPDGATIHDAHVSRPVDPEAGARAELELFERQHLPPTVALHRAPPEPWLKALALPELPVRWSESLVAYLHYFRDDPKGQSLIRGWVKRMGRYEGRLRAILKEVGVPEDLVFVAMAESGFNPRRRSRVGAAGMWQFMEGTGRVYGLERSFWIDERLDVERSTYAAAAYLKDLRVRFGSWEMALAAYNAGYGLVMTSVGRYNTNNFWSLCEIESGLPEATTHYIPKIVAAAVVGRNRGAFAVTPGEVSPLAAIDYAEIEVPAATSIASVAKHLEVDPALLAELNARYVRGRTPPDGGPYPLRVPRERERAATGLGARLSSESAGLSTYVVRLGDTTASIARRVGASESAIKQLNGLQDSAELGQGVVLAVPRGKSASPAAAGDRPLAAVPAVLVPAGHRLVFFESTRATTPRGLAEAFGVSWEALIAWNDLDPQARIQPGQILQVIVADRFRGEASGVRVYESTEVDHVIRGSREHLDRSLGRRGLVRRGYKAHSGDTLEKIGKKFDLSEGDIARINGVPRSYSPKSGEVMVVYVAEGKTRGTVAAPDPGPIAGAEYGASATASETADGVEVEPPADLAGTPAAEAAASTADTAKVPGQQGWRRSPSKSKGEKGKGKGKSRDSKAKESKSKASASSEPTLPGVEDP
ncbi:MAG: LysM peptidoglycan-binding domain-containing protein [Nannocystaceae bacterium]